MVFNLFAFIKANDNRYEGGWENDKKNGNGKYFFLNKGQLIEGFWINDVCKSSQVVDFDRENATNPALYPIPKVLTIFYYKYD